MAVAFALRQAQWALSPLVCAPVSFEMQPCPGGLVGNPRRTHRWVRPGARPEGLSYTELSVSQGGVRGPTLGTFTQSQSEEEDSKCPPGSGQRAKPLSSLLPCL